MLINFIAAAIGMLLFRHNDAHNFGTLPAAFVSIWMIETLDNWEELMQINMFGCDVYGYDEGSLARPCTAAGAQGFGWIAAAYFVFMVRARGRARCRRGRS